MCGRHVCVWWEAWARMAIKLARDSYTLAAQVKRTTKVHETIGKGHQSYMYLLASTLSRAFATPSRASKNLSSYTPSDSGPTLFSCATALSAGFISFTDSIAVVDLGFCVCVCGGVGLW